jgi:cytoplasmic iron level regulating protein YaaA (DUF328/UPF0246 family)
MYVRELFKKSLQYARQLKPTSIYILSAKYGLLELTDIIEPYELTLNDMTENEKRLWANKVIRQCKRKQIDFNDKAVFLCGNNYRKYIVPMFPNSEVPLKHLPIGKQLQFYKNSIKRR